MKNALFYKIFHPLRGVVLYGGCLIFLGIFHISVQAQNSLFEAGHIEQLEEARELKRQAEEYQIRANEVYLEAAMLQQSDDFDENKKLQRQNNKLEKRARKFEMDAAETYAESNEMIAEAYKEAIDNYWKDFDGSPSDLVNAKLIEETGREYLYRGESLREEAEKLDDPNAVYLKLSEAYEMELMGLEKLETALAYYEAWPEDPTLDGNQVDQIDENDEQVAETFYTPAEPAYDTSSRTDLLQQNREAQISTGTEDEYTDALQSSSADTIPKTTLEFPDVVNSETQNQSEILKQPETITSEDGAVTIDTKTLEKYQKLLNTAQQDTMVLLEEEVNGYDVASIQQFWDRYRSTNYDYPAQELLENDTLARIVGMEPEEPAPESRGEEIAEQKAVEDASVRSGGQQQNVQSGSTETQKDFSSDEPDEIGVVTEKLLPDPNARIFYRVQIAANRTPLSQGILQKVYMEDQQIGMVNEDGWYKYSIGDFDTYASADSFKRKMNIPESFIVAYRDAVNVQMIDSLRQTDAQAKLPEDKVSPNDQPVTTAQVDNESIYYVVQIAASRTPLTSTQLRTIYDGDKKVLSRLEEGWYKYQINKTEDYHLARKARNDANVTGSFIVAYKGDEKLTLWRALLKTQPQSEKITFYLQIAASKEPLSQGMLRKIFRGHDEIIERKENGWYKYQIEAGNSYDAARRLKNLWGIRGSFIIAYRNGEKVDLRNAINMTNN